MCSLTHNNHANIAINYRAKTAGWHISASAQYIMSYGPAVTPTDANIHAVTLGPLVSPPVGPSVWDWVFKWNNIHKSSQTHTLSHTCTQRKSHPGWGPEGPGDRVWTGFNSKCVWWLWTLWTVVRSLTLFFLEDSWEIFQIHFYSLISQWTLMKLGPLPHTHVC